MLSEKTIGKPYAGNPHVRFDEGTGTTLVNERSSLLLYIF